MKLKKTAFSIFALLVMFIFAGNSIAEDNNFNVRPLTLQSMSDYQLPLGAKNIIITRNSKTTISNNDSVVGIQGVDGGPPAPAEGDTISYEWTRNGYQYKEKWKYTCNGSQCSWEKVSSSMVKLTKMAK